MTIHTEGDCLPLNPTHNSTLPLVARCCPVSPRLLFHQLPAVPDHPRTDLDAASGALSLVLSAQRARSQSLSAHSGRSALGDVSSSPGGAGPQVFLRQCCLSATHFHRTATRRGPPLGATHPPNGSVSAGRGRSPWRSSRVASRRALATADATGIPVARRPHRAHAADADAQGHRGSPFNMCFEFAKLLPHVKIP